MKLYDAPQNSRIRLSDGTELQVLSINGTYRSCKDDDGEIWHIMTSEDVEVIDERKMDRDTILRLAREAGVMPITEFAMMGAWITYDDVIHRFAALVAAHEREECAKVAELCIKTERYVSIRAANAIAAAIRSRT